MRLATAVFRLARPYVASVTMGERHRAAPVMMARSKSIWVVEWDCGHRHVVYRKSTDRTLVATMVLYGGFGLLYVALREDTKRRFDELSHYLDSKLDELSDKLDDLSTMLESKLDGQDRKFTGHKIEGRKIGWQDVKIEADSDAKFTATPNDPEAKTGHQNRIDDGSPQPK